MAKQEHLPGDDFQNIPELDDLIEQLNDHRTKRLSHGAEETRLQASLLSAMHRHKLTTYGDQELDCFAEIVPGEEKVKVRSKKKDDEEE